MYHYLWVISTATIYFTALYVFLLEKWSFTNTDTQIHLRAAQMVKRCIYFFAVFINKYVEIGIDVVFPHCFIHSLPLLLLLSHFIHLFPAFCSLLFHFLYVFDYVTAIVWLNCIMDRSVG